MAAQRPRATTPLVGPPSKNKPRSNLPVQITSCTKLLCAVCRRSTFQVDGQFFQIKLLSMPTKLAAVCPLRSHRRGLLSRRTKKASGRPSRDDSKYRALLCRGKHLLPTVHDLALSTMANVTGASLFDLAFVGMFLTAAASSICLGPSSPAFLDEHQTSLLRADPTVLMTLAASSPIGPSTVRSK